ncbi:MAG TPA: YciI family protein [Nitrolancea sp.]|nr:YciI family protein [Nitrolancea sp.]
MKFVVVFSYTNQDKIAEVRPAHREYLAALKANGKLAASGPFVDDSGALIIYEADSEEETQKIIEGDPFHESGIFASYLIRAWHQVY